ncbi:Eukaryotic translation initiation factor 3 subunit E-A [Liparis tanakae]|uniref:Eukaryotic translation initiation factor 3 subunit E-A n=1 Tax=Liparis tanakae TaxID=230148 RepID=A0A4Z2FXN0_9TELE|nr:Eukaryotic translation initiation factor 3 subunit E-A [Liparis tanakae]
MLADKLNMTPEDAERWIVNLIRNARLDAKIDSKLGHVVMGNNAISPYQQVIEKTKSLSFRSQMLAMNIEKKQAQSTKNEAIRASLTERLLSSSAGLQRPNDKVEPRGHKGGRSAVTQRRRVNKAEPRSLARSRRVDCTSLRAESPLGPLTPNWAGQESGF